MSNLRQLETWKSDFHCILLIWKITSFRIWSRDVFRSKIFSLQHEYLSVFGHPLALHNVPRMSYAQNSENPALSFVVTLCLLVVYLIRTCILRFPHVPDDCFFFYTWNRSAFNLQKESNLLNSNHGKRKKHVTMLADIEKKIYRVLASENAKFHSCWVKNRVR